MSGLHRASVPWLRVALVVAVVIGGVGATVATWRQESDRVEQENGAVADRAQVLLSAIGATIDGSLAGSAAIVQPDGTIDAEAFAAFANELTSPTGLSALAFEQVVPAEGRAEFEARIGRPIIDRPPEGPVTAPPRPEHYVVVNVLPYSERTEQLIGFDLLGDPVRAAVAQQARDAGTTLFSEPVPSQPTRTLSVFVIKPVYRLGVALDSVEARQANLVAFVSTTFLAETIGTAMEFVLPEGTDFEIHDGTALLASSGEVDPTVERTAGVANRQWTLAIDLGGADRAVPFLIAGFTALVTAALVYELVRSIRRHRRDRLAARRTEDLARLAGGLATLTSSEDVMTFLTTHVLAPLGASHAAVAVIDGDQLHRSFTPDERTTSSRQLVRTVPLDADMPLAQAARTGAPVLIPDVSVVRDRYPHLVDGWTRLGFHATANLPLRDRHGMLIGALGLAWDRATDLDELRDAMATVSGIAGQTIDRARLSDAEHRLVTTMQEGLLTPLPSVEGLELAQRYLPAVEDVGMGGDWYEGIALDEHRVLIVVGDIAGHGIPAVAKMAQLRSTIGTIAALGTPIEDILPLAAAVPQNGMATVATAAVIEIDVRAGRIRYACAGHLPPLVRAPDGSVAVLEDGRQPLLGVPMTDRVVGTHPFPPGSVLVCFTDGLIERPGEGIDVSIDRLADQLAEAGTSAEAIATELLARSVTGAPRDDVVLAVVVRSPAPAQRPRGRSTRTGGLSRR